MPDSVNRKLRIQGLERREVTLVLRYEDHDTKHFCLFCQSRSPLFVSRGRALAVIYGNSYGDIFALTTLTPTVSFQCKECGTTFQIVSVSQ